MTRVSSIITHRAIACMVLCFFVLATHAQQVPPPNYDEAKVPHYVLPDVLTCADGQRVTNKSEWERKRRPELMEVFSSLEYGRTPKEKIRVAYTLIEENPNALGGLATMQQVRLRFEGNGRHINTLLLAYIPNARKGRVPVMIGYNFRGNHSITPDESIIYSPYFAQLANRADPLLERGNQSSRWPLEMIIRRGYALVTMCYQDMFPDNAKGRPESAAALFSDYRGKPLAEDAWQALGVWAWGSSRIADWVEQQPWADKERLAIMGHSRQGKAALWAGAQDTRFRVVISNDSGCGGAALSKRVYGESVAKITTTFPHWFCPAFSRYAQHEADLPFDQHELIALMAPRHVYVASAEEDNWADQRGEFLAAYHAGPVFELYGLQGLGTDRMPAIHQPIMHRVAYHIRAGKHDVTDYDWTCYLDFCDKAWKEK